MRHRTASAVLALVLAGGPALGGALLGTTGEAAAASALGVETVAGGNGPGSAANQLRGPTDVVVDGAGNVYVADQLNNRVQEWAPGASAGVTVASGNEPVGVAVDKAGNVYVADYGDNEVQKWAPGATSGVTVAGGNGAGPAANQLDGPTSVSVDSAGDVYIADGSNNRVQKWAPGATSGLTVAGGNGAGPAADQVDFPAGLFVNGAGDVYVSDQGNCRVQEWSPSATAGVTVAGGNGCGTAANQFLSPNGIFVDGAGDVYVTDSGSYANARVLEWAPGATAGITVAGHGIGAAADQLDIPAGVWVNSAGNVYVADFSNERVQLWGTLPDAAPSFIESPQSQSVLDSDNVSFAASADGAPFPTVQWQQSTDDGSTWSDIAGATSETFTITDVPLSDNREEFRAVLTNVVGSATTSAAMLAVQPAIAPTITMQPLNWNIRAGQEADFLAQATAAPQPTWQWQLSTDGGSTWSDISGASGIGLGAAYSIVATRSENGDEFRAVYTNAGGSTATDPATLTVEPVKTTVLLPANGATISGDAALDAGASANAIGVVFEITNGTLKRQYVVATATKTLYGWLAQWNTTTVPNGTYTLTSVANAGGPNGISPPVTITVDNPPPTTSVLIPSGGTTLSGTAAVLDASASANVSKVTFRLRGGTLAGRLIATATPTLYGWLAEWNTTSVPNGTYTLRSVAAYPNGAKGTSAPVTVTVRN